MPTVLRQEGHEVVIYINDHPPAHVHAFREGGEAKINLDPVEVVQAWNMKKATTRKAKRVVAENQAYLLEEMGGDQWLKRPSTKSTSQPCAPRL